MTAGNNEVADEKQTDCFTAFAITTTETPYHKKKIKRNNKKNPSNRKEMKGNVKEMKGSVKEIYVMEGQTAKGSGKPGVLEKRKPRGVFPFRFFRYHNDVLAHLAY